MVKWPGQRSKAQTTVEPKNQSPVDNIQPSIERTTKDICPFQSLKQVFPTELLLSAFPRWEN